MGRKPKSATTIRKVALGLLDDRSTDNDGMLIKRDRKVDMIDIFGTEQKTAVAYYVSDLLAKGFNNQQIIVAVKDRYGLDWKMNQVRIMKELLHKMWRCEIAHTMNDQIAREVATIDTQLKETWEAWEFSKKGIKHKTTRNTNSESEAPEMAYKLEEVINNEDVTAGDVKFLQHINDLGKEKRKLLGLYAPDKKAGDDTKTAVQFNIVGEGSGEITSLMTEIIKGAQGMPMPAQQQNTQEPIQEAEVVDTKAADEENDIDALMEAIMDD